MQTGLQLQSSFCSILPLRNPNISLLFSTAKVTTIGHVICSTNQSSQTSLTTIHKKTDIKKEGKREHHLWKRRDSMGSGQKALNLVRIVSQLPNDKEAVYGALDKWIAWEAEFPLIAVAKALKILQKRSQWLCVIQV